MKKIIVFGCILASVLMITISLNPVVGAKTSKVNNLLDQIQSYISNDDETKPTWFPGFLIVQLIKGVLAFFIILLMLLDLIEPES